MIAVVVVAVALALATADEAGAPPVVAVLPVDVDAATAAVVARDSLDDAAIEARARGASSERGVLVARSEVLAAWTRSMRAGACDDRCARDVGAAVSADEVVRVRVRTRQDAGWDVDADLLTVERGAVTTTCHGGAGAAGEARSIAAAIRFVVGAVCRGPPSTTRSTGPLIASGTVEISQAIHFDAGSARLGVGPGIEPLLREIAEGLAGPSPAALASGAVVVDAAVGPAVRARIVGHADASSGAKARALSLARARAVADRLVALGVDARALVVVGLGGAQPRASSKTAAGRANNDRVEVLPVRDGALSPFPGLVAPPGVQ